MIRKDMRNKIITLSSLIPTLIVSMILCGAIVSHCTGSDAFTTAAAFSPLIIFVPIITYLVMNIGWNNLSEKIEIQEIPKNISAITDSTEEIIIFANSISKELSVIYLNSFQEELIPTNLT